MRTEKTYCYVCKKLLIKKLYIDNLDKDKKYCLCLKCKQRIKKIIGGNKDGYR